MRTNWKYIGVGLVAIFFISTVLVRAATILYPVGGGTGTSTPPTYGQIPVGNAGGTYTLTATSSLNISASPLAGTVGQVAYFSSTNNAVGTSSLVIDTTSNVGISSTSPSALLSVGGGTIWQTSGIAALTGSFVSEQIPTSLVSVGNYLYVGMASTTGTGLQIFDVSNPASPYFVASYNTIGGDVRSLAVADGIVYATESSNTAVILEAIDVRNINTPVSLGTLSLFSSANTASPVVVQGGYAYIGGSAALTTVNITNPTSMSRVSSISTTNTPFAMIVRGSYLYLAKNNAAAALAIVDISNAGNPQIVGLLGFNDIVAVRTNAISLQGRYLYTLGNSAASGIRVVDISNPTAPYTVSTTSLTGAGGGLVAAGPYLYVTQNAGATRMTIFDIASSSQPVLVGASTFANGSSMMQLIGKYVYTSASNSTTIEFAEVPGARFPGITTGFLSTGRLMATGPANFSGNVSIESGLNVGRGGIYSTGGIFSYLASSTATSTAVSGVFMGGNVGIGTTTPRFPLVVESGATNNNTYLTGSVNDFMQGTIQNRNSGTAASSDWIVCNNLATVDGTCSTYYGDYGVNSSTYTQAGFSGETANDVYLTASDSWLDLGAASTTGAFGIRFFTGGLDTANTRMVITSTGNVGIGTTTPGSLLTLQGTTPTLSLYDSVSGTLDTVSNTAGGLTFNTTNGNSIVFQQAGTERMRILTAGNVGIGTTTPSTKFSLQGNAYISGTSFFGGAITATSTLSIAGAITSTATTPNTFPFASSTALTVSGSAYFATLGGNVGIGTTTPTAKLSVHANATETNTMLFAVASSTSSATTTHFTVKNDGTVFAPNTTSAAVAQTGYWCYDAAGQFVRVNTTCLVSALRFKKDITDIDAGLETVLKMRPVNYYLKDTMGDPNNADQQFGFIADEAQVLDPRLVTRNSEGSVQSFRYEQYTAILTKAIQELNDKVDGKTIVVTAKRTVEEDWQWACMALLALLLAYQQVQIKRLKK